MKFEYSLVLFAIVLFPLMLSRDKNLKIFSHSSALMRALLGAAIPFWIWDVIATARGHWSFNPQFVLGLHFLGLPLEEWMFFLVVAFVSIFTWESVRFFMEGRK